VDIETRISEIVAELESAPREAWIWSERIELEDLSFSDFDALKGGRVAAVDGSSGIAEPMGGLYLALIRAGYVIYSDEREKKEMSPIDVFQLGFHNSEEIYERKYEDIFGEKPVRMGETDPKYMVQRIRTLEEYRYAFLALEELNKGDILLVDGALRGDRHTPDIAIKMLSERAQDRGVSVAGISKNSGMSMSGLPLIPMIEFEAEKSGPKRWFTRISGRISGGKEEVYAVKYNPMGESAFRTDLISLERAGDVFGKIAWYSNDVAYPGYPYPLADIHNEVIIRSGTVEDISSRFYFEAARKGMAMSENFHKKLDRGV